MGCFQNVGSKGGGGDVCHYCTFAQTPKKIENSYVPAERYWSCAVRVTRMGCREALRKVNAQVNDPGGTLMNESITRAPCSAVGITG